MTSGSNYLKDFSLLIEYNILFQGSNYLCVNDIGYEYIKGTPHPTDLFYTVNIDLKNGIRLRLADMVNIDDEFVSIVRKYINRYISNSEVNTVEYTSTLQNYSNYSLVYEYELEHDDAYFMRRFLESDLNIGNDYFSFFTEDVFGISIPTSFVAGNHFEIEIYNEDLRNHLIIKGLLRK